MKLQYGLCNPSLDEEIEGAILESDPNITDKKLLKEMIKVKKKMTLYNKYNTKAKANKKPKKEK